MKTSQDLVAAIQRMHQHYRAGRIDRDILRGWVLGLPSYPEPHGAAVRELKTWFATRQTDITPDVQARDLQSLASVADAGTQ